MNNRHFFAIIALLSLSISSIIAFDLFPLLRGPAPYPPEWQWPYLFSNTLSNIWAPILTGAGIIFLAFLSEKRTLTERRQGMLLTGVILLGFLFQLSILFYSRAGVNVLIHRILNPEITSYFAASLRVESITSFLRDFNDLLPSLPMYAKYHPPFATLLFSAITYVAQFTTPVLSFITHVSPSHSDVAIYWNVLTPTQKNSSIVSGFLVMLLSLLAVIPLYFSAKEVYGYQSAVRSLFLFVFIPSVILFTPMNDVFMPIFTAGSLYFFIRGLKRNSKYGYFLSGLILSLGSLFSLTFLPITLFFIILGFLFIYKSRRDLEKLLLPITSWSFGFLLLPFTLFLLYGYNFIETVIKILHHHNLLEHQKRYILGLFYAPFDFFLFLGIPLCVLAFSGMITLLMYLKNRGVRNLEKNNFLPCAFWVFLIVVTLSGSVRFESARIWTPYIPLAVLVGVAEMQRRKIATNQFLFILILLIIQVIVFQTVLVTVW